MNKKPSAEENNSKNSLFAREKIDLICNILASDKDISPEIRKQILELINLVKEMGAVAKNQKKTTELLRQAMGLLPTKEREGKSPPPNPEIWSKDIENKLLTKCNKAYNIWKAYKDNKPQKAAQKKTRVSQTQACGTNRSPESVFQMASAKTQNESEDIVVNREFDVPNNLIQPSSTWDKRIRYDVNLTITRTEYRVETLRCPITGFSKTATIDVGPAKYRVTYNTMAQLTLLVYGMGIPLVRLAASLSASEEYFNPSRIYRLCLHTARALASVYLVLFENLAWCDYLSGDDTFNSVLEMRTDEEQIEKEAFNNALLLSKKEPDPQKADFVIETQSLLGSQMPRKDGKGFKKSIFTTVVIGKNQDEQIVFYQTERKSFGDVLGKILAIRENNIELKKKKCTIQSDLSSSNIPNPMPIALLLAFLGCSAHARRPFWRYRTDADPEVQYYCYTMLLLFDKIADSDRDARETNNEKSILLARQEIQKPLWEEILTFAQEIQDRFAPNSDFAKAGDYIVNNFKELTYYLSDPLTKPDNNLAERLLRYEKIMLDNSKFRVTKKGRLAYDIIRTILTTCQANGVDAREYLVHILKNQLDVRQNPRNHTPYAFAKQQKK